MDTTLGDGRDRDAFGLAAGLGLDGVEVTLARAELRARETPLRALRHVVSELVLEIPSLALVEHNDGGLADADGRVAEAAEEDVRQAVQWAVAVGAGAILVPFFLRGEIRDEAGFERAAAAFERLCPYASAHGVSLCCESTLAADEVRLLAERVASPAFACYFDLANPLRRGGDPAAEIVALGPLVGRVHVKDTLLPAGDCRLGAGQVDFAACALALDEIGYDGWLVVEAPPASPDVLADEVALIREVFA